MTDERGAFPAALGIVMMIVLVGIMWSVFNEAILRVGEWSSAFPAERYGGVDQFLIFAWRITPFVFLIAGVLWGVLKAHRSVVEEAVEGE